MKEYKMHSSWTLYEIPCNVYQLFCLSSNGDIIVRGYASYDEVGYFIYNVRGDLLTHFDDLLYPFQTTDPVYTESLLPFPSDIKNKDKKKKTIKKRKENGVMQW
ncbi:uncharacterized protein LOC107473079 [Arachis duranensis]|uniref:Uncharacterized protein LOC107473079 n=1 Tax=Arachis duranensis TaxID=130453 RepID=A0A6P4BUC5_ARADU|nr:uncharacterized protein LOC107473079 [Arachis duranensis]